MQFANFSAGDEVPRANLALVYKSKKNVMESVFHVVFTAQGILLYSLWFYLTISAFIVNGELLSFCLFIFVALT